MGPVEFQRANVMNTDRTEGGGGVEGGAGGAAAGGAGVVKKKSGVETHEQKFPKFGQMCCTKVTLATPNFGIFQTNCEGARRPAKVRRC